MAPVGVSAAVMLQTTDWSTYRVHKNVSKGRVSHQYCLLHYSDFARNITLSKDVITPCYQISFYCYSNRFVATSDGYNVVQVSWSIAPSSGTISPADYLSVRGQCHCEGITAANIYYIL
jgi:hypothetical protein